MNKHLTIEIALTVLVIVFAVLFINKSVTVEKIEVPFGAVPGPNIDYPEICMGGVCSYYSVASCANATTTLFSIKNPWNATSTVDFVQISGLNGTTTIDFEVGTTTTSTGIAKDSSISGSLIDITAIATSTGFFVVGGQMGSGAESHSSGATTLRSVVVAPAEYITGFATSTSGSASATYDYGITGANNSFTCTYRIRWIK